MCTTAWSLKTEQAVCTHLNEGVFFLLRRYKCSVLLSALEQRQAPPEAFVSDKHLTRREWLAKREPHLAPTLGPKADLGVGKCSPEADLNRAGELLVHAVPVSCLTFHMYSYKTVPNQFHPSCYAG